MPDIADRLAADLDRWNELDRAARRSFAERCRELAHASDREFERLLSALMSLPDAPSRALVSIFGALLARQQGRGRPSLTAAQRVQVTLLYKQLGPECRARHRLLGLLATARTIDDCDALVEILIADPPAESRAAAELFALLMQLRGPQLARLFPRIWEAVRHRSLAPCVLDLANFLARELHVAPHPLAAQSTSLKHLLDQVVDQLERWSAGPPPSRQTLGSAAQVVEDGIALAVALCDALALMAAPDADPVLRRVLVLGHRRLRVEAAAALARRGNPDGAAALLSLAAEPVVRLRVLAYAAELGLDDRIPLRYRSARARAEGELVSTLAQPAYFGSSPQELELIDQRTMVWPGFDQPVHCFLFRFTYRHADREYSNIGIAGPISQTVTADLSDLSPEDIYAVFAGGQVEHAEMFQFDLTALPPEARADHERLRGQLCDAGFELDDPVTMGSFFGERILLAPARWTGKEGVAVASARGIRWYPSASTHPLGPAEIWCLETGRRLLGSLGALKPSAGTDSPSGVPT